MGRSYNSNLPTREDIKAHIEDTTRHGLGGGAPGGTPALTENYTFRGNSSDEAEASGILLNDGSSLEFVEHAKFDKTAVFDVVYNNGNSGGSKTIDWTLGNKQKITTTGSCTLTFTAPEGACNLQLTIIHENSATAYTYTYPGTVKWAESTKIETTNTANAVDIISLFWDGTNYYTMGNTAFG